MRAPIAVAVALFNAIAATAIATVPAPAWSADAVPNAAPAAASAAAASPAAAAGDLLPVPAQAVMESTRGMLRSSSQWLARGVDSWFGDQPFEEGGKVSDGRLTVGLFKRQDQSLDFDVRFNAHFRLPNVEKFAYVFIGRDDRRDAVQDTPEAFRRQQQLLPDRPADRSFLAGLGLSLREVVDLRIGIGARLKPYAQARYDRPWQVADGHLVDFRETVFWTHDDRFGSTTALSYDYTYSPTVAIRWLNAVTITQETRNCAWSSSLAAFKSLGRQRVVSVEALAGGTGRHGTGVGSSDLGLLLRWEQPVYKDWLLGELVAGHFWPRPDAMSERGRAWAAGANLKMQF